MAVRAGCLEKQGKLPRPAPACRMCWRSQAPNRSLLLPCGTRGSQCRSEGWEVFGGAGGGCLNACGGHVLAWGQGLFFGVSVLSFRVSVSAQLLPFNTRDGHCAHKILICSRPLKATKFGDFLAFLIVGSVEEEVVG